MPLNFFSWLRDDSLERIGIPYDESQSERPMRVGRRRNQQRPRRAMDGITAAAIAHSNNNINSNNYVRNDAAPLPASASPRLYTSHHVNNNNNDEEDEMERTPTMTATTNSVNDTSAAAVQRVRRNNNNNDRRALGVTGAGESVFRHWAPTVTLLDELSDPTGTADFTRNSSQRIGGSSSFGRSPPEGRPVRRSLGNELLQPARRNNNNNNNDGSREEAMVCGRVNRNQHHHMSTQGMMMMGPHNDASPTVMHSATMSTSICFTCSGHPIDIVRFLSCVPDNLPRHTTTSNAAQGGSGSRRQAKSDETLPPAAQGPFSADIFSIILLYVDATSMSTILQVGATCRFWRYYANYAPHWTYFRNQRWRTCEVDLPRYVRAIVQKPKIVTRDEYCEERRKVEEHRRRSEIITGARHVRSCVLLAFTVAAWLTVNYVIAFLLGFSGTALHTDGVLGFTAFVCLFIAALLELVLVVTPLARHCLPYSKDTTMRLLAWSLFLVVFSVIFGMITSLALSRVAAERRVLAGPTLNFSMTAPCTAYSTSNAERRPSFVALPAPLVDLRWRPITADEQERQLEPFCLSGLGADWKDTTYCFILLFFDAFYESAVFRDSNALHAGRDIGTHTALGFSPFDVHYPQEWSWCARLNRSQIIALSATTYTDVVAPMRNALFPSDADWLDPLQRPLPDYRRFIDPIHISSASGHNSEEKEVSNSESFTMNSDDDSDDSDEWESLVSYRCASDIPRATTEDVRGAAFAWFDNTNQWRWLRIPLVTTRRGTRAAVRARQQHFSRYTTACYIISAIVWGLLFFAQVFFRGSANSILGVLTVIVLLLLNPLTMIIAGALCVRLSENDVMCGPRAGGALIGGGIALLFLLLTIYVSARG